ncbi:MAG TPA: extracellular solute-binding protein [Terriglobia bacterium]|nr:extracellular solute-binding protein [Terriglobia bacterium]
MKYLIATCAVALVVALWLWRGRAQTDGLTLTIWSHEADEPAKVALREYVARQLEKAHPALRVKITWYEIDGLSTALKTALPAGQGPDVFYIQSDQTDYITNGYVAPLDDLIDWSNIYDWARQAWLIDGKTWAVPQEVYTDELYYNKRLLAQLGFTLPADAQFTQDEFFELVEKARAAGITPIAQGAGDRDFPGAYILTQALLRKLGPEDYGKLFDGTLSFSDPRVADVFRWVKSLVDAGAYPKNFMTMKLAEAHYYFYQRPGAVMLPMGSWYTGRAFVPVDDGGQPPDFPLGIMQFPAMNGGACNECKTRAVGASFAINAASRHKELAAEYLNRMSTPEIGKRWIETVYLQSAVKTDVSSIGGSYGAYYKELMDRQRGAKYFPGDPSDFIHGQCLDTFTQVMNTSFPGGLLSVERAIELMNQGCYTAGDRGAGSAMNP